MEDEAEVQQGWQLRYPSLVGEWWEHVTIKKVKITGSAGSILMRTGLRESKPKVPVSEETCVSSSAGLWQEGKDRAGAAELGAFGHSWGEDKTRPPPQDRKIE